MDQIENGSDVLPPPKTGTPDASKTEAILFHDRTHRVEFTDEFKYLGGLLTRPLTDEIEIKKRIRQASNQMGALANFFKSVADLKTKRLVFQAMPLNTVLYGCESWMLTAELKRKLRSFFTKCCVGS